MNPCAVSGMPFQSQLSLSPREDPVESTPLYPLSKSAGLPIDGQPKVSRFIIEGMSCSSCAARIESSLNRLSGVREALVSIANLTCTVVHDSQQVNTAQLAESIKSLGYTPILDGEDTLGCVTGKLLISGMSCASCAARIEEAVRLMEGVRECNVNFATSTCTLAVDREERLNEMIGIITSMGYTVAVSSESQEIAITQTRKMLERTREIREEKMRFIGAVVLAAPLAVIMFLMATTNVLHSDLRMNIADALQLALTTPIVCRFGAGFFVRAWRDFQHMVFTMDTLVAIGTGVSYVYSLFAFLANVLISSHMTTYFDTAGMLLAFMLLGRYLEACAKRSTSEALIELMSLVPPTAIVVTPEGDMTIPSALVKKGMRIRVLAGDRIPVDGVVVEGMSEVDEQIVTGESVPKSVKPGTAVVGGTTNVTALLLMEARRVGEETMLAQILRVVQEAQNSKPPVQRIADKIAMYFVPLVIGFSLLIFLTWMTLGFCDLYPAEWRTSNNESVTRFAFNFFIASIVSACPCALGLATPTAIMVGTGVGAKSGILVKSGTTLECVRRSRCVVFDKTGTITNGRLQIVFNSCFGGNSEAVMSAVRAVERNSNHPIAKAIEVGLFSNARPAHHEVVSCQTFGGLGTSAIVRDLNHGTEHTVHVGNAALMKQEGVKVPLEAQSAFQRQSDLGHTVVLCALDGIAALVVGLSDEPKDEAHGVIRFLRKHGFRVLMVSGDNRSAAAHVAQDVGIPIADVHAEVLPAEKADIVRHLQASGEVVIFVGDGINDSPALAQANVGVALGAGTDIAMVAADVVLVRNSLVDLLNLQALSVATVRRVYGNFVWAFGYNIIMLPLASGMLYPLLHMRLPPLLAGAAMVLSSLSVLTSSLSLRCIRPHKTEKFISL